MWVEFSKLSGQETINLKKNEDQGEKGQAEKKALAFYQWMINRGLSENTAKTAVGCLRGFYASNRYNLVFTKDEKRPFGDVARKYIDYRFVKEDLFRMYEQGNTQERYILTMGKSLGLRVSDFLTITMGQLRCLHLDSEAPISFGEIITMKERTKAFPFLDSDALTVCKAILEKYKDKTNSDPVLDFKDEQPINLALKRMFNAAGLVSGGQVVRFHNLRKFCIDRLSAVASESQWKQIIGKHIEEGAYISQDQLRDVYSRAMPSLLINGHSKNNIKLEQLESALLESQKLIAAQEQTLRVLREEIVTTNTKNESRFNELFSMMTTEDFRRRREKAREHKEQK
jgi:hypothetical protein